MRKVFRSGKAGEGLEKLNKTQIDLIKEFFKNFISIQLYKFLNQILIKKTAVRY